MSGFARIKRGVRASIKANGGVECAAMTLELKHSRIGDFNNLNTRALPSVEQLVALDEVAICERGVAPILSAIARELGFVAVQLPAPMVDDAERSAALIDAMAEVGDIPATYRERAADGEFSREDAEALHREIDEAIEKLMALQEVNAACFRKTQSDDAREAV